MRRSIVSVSLALLLSSCTRSDSPWDQKIAALIQKADAGDVNAAAQAYFYCVDDLYLEDAPQPSTFVGPCGGLLSLWIDNTFQAGSVTQVRNLMISLHGMQNRPGIARRMPYYEAMAAQRIAQLGAAPPTRP